MKKIVVLLLCLCMILPMAFALAFSAGATTVAAEAPLVSTDKAVYLPGEDIKVTATKTVEGSWVGIVPADEDGDPIISQGTIYWESIPTEGLTDLSIKGHNTIDGKADALAELMSVSKDDMLNLCAGRYFVAHISSPKGIVAATNEDPDLVTYVPFTVADKITMEKTTFKYGDDILVTPLYKNAATDYVGISHVKDDGTIGQNLYYTYITDANLNTPIVIQDGVLYGADKEVYGRLPAGRYVVYFAPNDAGAHNRDKTSDIYIDVVGATVEKTEFKYGEPIWVTGYGAGKDWIGISQYDASTASGYWSNGSIRWRYIAHTGGNAASDGLGSGVAFDIREAKLTNAAAARGDLPVGDYVIFVGLDDCYAEEVSPYTEIHISITADAPDAPSGVTYVLNDERTGLAGGKLTVTFAEASMALHKKPTKVELYWADAEGNALADYGKIGNRKITGATTEIELTESMVIPAEAKKLMVRAFNGAGYATEAVAADVPEHGYRTTGDKLASFQIVSDMHIGRTNTDAGGVNLSDKHAQMLFEDIKELDPDSVGIFVAGDAADHGQEAEYERLFTLWATANQNGLKPNLYIGVGNHEMMKDTSGHNYNNDYDTQANRFLTFANQSLAEGEKTETPYYYVNRGGQHFIFLATEYCGTHAYLSNDQLDWLKAKLAEVAADGAPVFIMLHQPLYNTVAGGLANEDGSKRQGWHGVIAGDENFEAWKALVAEKGVNTSDHGLMYGQYEQPLRDILKQYPSAMMFSGHSHWIMESVGNIYEATEAQPNYMFNTASVSYLWTDNDDLYGGYDPGEGSQGYFVTVYENCIEFRGRDFVNGKWIPGAYYRVWLDCAHEGETLCDTVCKWCGGENTNAIPCDGEDACSVKCVYCGEDTVKDAIPCDGEDACSVKCIHCGEDTVKDAIPCDGAFDCATVCVYCGEATVADSTAHTQEKECDAKCSVCGEEIEHEEHKGLYLCSETCRWCDTPVDHVDHVGANGCEKKCMHCGIADVEGTGHERAFDCSVVCKNCGADMTEGAATHEGIAPCATVCKYGCDTAVIPESGATHAGEYACSESCTACGEAITADASHAGAFTCSDKCATCGIEITPVSDHNQSAMLCSGKCSICDQQVFEPAEHEGAFACSTVCQYGCDTVVVPTADHEIAFECSESCSVCSEGVGHVDHEGAEACSTVCKYGCGTAVETEVAHTAAFACSVECAVCAEAIAPEAGHTNAIACSTACDVCGATVEANEAHTASFACSTACAVCGEAIRPTEEHTTAYECDARCSVCNEEVEHKEHDGEYACSVICKYGCGNTVEDAVACSGAIACQDDICQYCGVEVEVLAHKGAYSCSTVCQYGCGTAVKAKRPHTKANACADTCLLCGETTAKKAHDYDNSCDPDCNECGYVREIKSFDHKYSNSCDSECNVCGYGRAGALHVYTGECDATCNICLAEREADEHSYNGDCDGSCDVCGLAREKGEHTFSSWTVVTAATTEATGLEERTCLYCDASESREVPKLTVDPNATQDLNTAPTVNLPVVGEVEQNTFILIVAVAGGVLLLIIIAIIAGVIRKKKKKAAKAKKEAEEATEEATEETTEDAAEEATEEVTEESTEEAEEATEEKKDEE